MYVWHCPANASHLCCLPGLTNYSRELDRIALAWAWTQRQISREGQTHSHSSVSLVWILQQEPSALELISWSYKCTTLQRAFNLMQDKVETWTSAGWGGRGAIEHRAKPCRGPVISDYVPAPSVRLSLWVHMRACYMRGPGLCLCQGWSH